MDVLIDTSFLLAMSYSRDKNYQDAHTLRQTLVGPRIVPAPVLPEVFYMMTQRSSYAKAVHLFELLQTPAFQIERLTEQDMARMHEIMRQYQDAEFDFVDVSIMTIAERLNVAQVCTFDRRDFAVFRPIHCENLRLLP